MHGNDHVDLLLHAKRTDKTAISVIVWRMHYFVLINFLPFEVKMTSFQLSWSADMSIAISKKNLLGVALVSVLAVASSAACAQSAEYRQGYDQGYRDATEARNHREFEREHEHEREREEGRIIIEEARYGVRDGGACDARDALQNAIGGHHHFEFTVGNELCGDPARGQPKHMHVRYRCGDSQSAHAEAPEGAVMALNCQ
jgi:hypothetical protein